MNETPEFDLETIIRKKSLHTHFQPIVSIKKKKIIGFEALSRGIDPESGQEIPPFFLFSVAQKCDKIVELDRACREKALEAFGNLHHKNPDLLLFLNFDTSMVDMGIVGSGNLLRMVREKDINPGNIVIEMVESRVRNFSELCRFIDNHRKYGFLIALDDFGAGHSNLERISVIKPEIIKIDRSLIQNVHTEFFKQEILKAIIKLTDQLGVMVLSEGVETYEEVMKTLELDTDLLQGYYFSTPQPLKELSLTEVNAKIQQTASDFFKNVITRIKISKEHFNNCQALGFSILSELKDLKDENIKLERELKNMISSYSIIECAYLLDESGRQISSTIMNNGHIHNLKNSQLFRPAELGDDHSLKDYYVYIQAGLGRFITDPYISLATGSLCRTISVSFTTRGNNKRILCLDMKENEYQ